MKNIRFETLLIRSLLFLMFGLIMSCNQKNQQHYNYNGTLDKIKKTKVLEVGYINYPPIVFKDIKTDSVKGIFVNAIKDICKEIDVKVNFKEVTWATFVAGLENEQFDLSIAPTFCTIQRAYAVSFTTPLIYVGNSAIVRIDEKRFSTLEDIDKKGIIIAVTQGEQGSEYAQKYIKNAEVKPLSQNDQNLAFTQVLTERADIALGDAFAVSKYVQEHKEVVKDLFKDKPYNLTGVSWAVRNNDIVFLNFLNTSIDVLETTGKLRQYEKLYGASFLHKEYNWR